MVYGTVYAFGVYLSSYSRTTPLVYPYNFSVRFKSTVGLILDLLSSFNYFDSVLPCGVLFLFTRTFQAEIKFLPQPVKTPSALVLERVSALWWRHEAKTETAMKSKFFNRVEFDFIASRRIFKSVDADIRKSEAARRSTLLLSYRHGKF